MAERQRNRGYSFQGDNDGVRQDQVSRQKATDDLARTRQQRSYCHPA